MRLVVTYSTSDGCMETYDHIACIEYESKEDFLKDLEKEVKKWLKLPYSARRSGATFKLFDISLKHFTEGEHYPPTVRTLEEWWEQEREHYDKLDRQRTLHRNV